MGVGGGGACCPLIIFGTSTFDLQSNEPFSKFLRQQRAISYFLSDVFGENTKFGGGESIHPMFTFNLNRDTKTFDCQSNEPPPKFIQSRFLYKPYVPPGHNL